MNTLATQKAGKAARENVPVEQNLLSPEVNIFETKEAYILEAEMPGVSKEGLEITLDGNELTLVGRRHEDSSELRSLYRESKPAHFRRTFELDPAIDTAKIKAKMEQGILTLELPKTERVKPRKINVVD